MLHENLPLDSGQQAFASDLISRGLTFFVAASDDSTGLIADRASFRSTGVSDTSSVAACGFGLSAFSIAAETGRMPVSEAADYVKRLLWSLFNHVDHFQGIFFHFVARSSGRRVANSEASTIDTALAVAGALHASSVFADDPLVNELALSIYERVDWQSMLSDDGCLHMGWTPKHGRLPYKWDQFSEHPILTLLAIASETYGIDRTSWLSWRREPQLHFDGEPFLSYPPLFVHQYPWAYFDVRNTLDPTGWDFWRNSQLAHLAQIRFQQQLAESQPEKFSHYGAKLWGLTSSDSVDGYRDWGGPFHDGPAKPERGIDGTVVPSAAGGGLAICPEEALRTLLYQKETYGASVYGPFGFINAFHPTNGWRSPDVIAIDTGITMLMAHNLLCGGVWNAFMKHPAAKRALTLAGFTPTAR
ncbi:glucoamylase family protein [Rhodopirellula sp. MGV]|uniref:glucoamylase family protein n=1 Tax=Rhodopirellula sp. MGV TaxID=2023130 RepID=UPI000B9706AA|nr:glucoamylase family protein [Rhodopirellula sp. MGV]OYP33925.1 hypothetical protein CGZ80_17220 [Rhodopirellula sp. MGV]PNY34093.1 hypothetical protein C2E31_25170 [Rhodopirellula baltica]